jgi:hypothetical protein
MSPKMSTDFSRWQPVIRYDTAHGYAHIDRYNLKGQTKKERLALTFSEALTRAERDLKQNWSVYRERFLRGGFHDESREKDG